MTSRGRSQLRRLRLPDGEGGGVRTVPCTPHVHSMLNNGGGSLISNFPLRREYHIRSLTLKVPSFKVLFVTSPPTRLSSLLDNRDALPVSGLFFPPLLRRWWGLQGCAGAESSGRCRRGAGDAAASLPF